MSCNNKRVWRRVGPDNEAGFAMIVAITVATVALVLALTVMAVGVNLDKSTFRDRQWNTALVVAESGIQDALVRYGDFLNGLAPAPGSFVGTASGGQYQVTIGQCGAIGPGCPQPDYLVASSTGFIPNMAAPKRKRQVRVTYGPDPQFAFALYSTSTLTLKAAAPQIDGDIYAKGNIVIENANTIRGDVISGEGTVDLGNSDILPFAPTGSTGSVFSGGVGPGNWGIRNAGAIAGDVEAQRLCGPPAPNLATAPGNIINSGTISGKGTAWGTVTGTAPVGGFTQACKERGVYPVPQTQSWATAKPIYEARYCGGVSCPFVREHTNMDSFNSLAGPLTGVHYVPNIPGTFAASPSSGCTLDEICLDGKTISGNFALFTAAKVDFGNQTDFVVAPANAIIDIIVLNPEPCGTFSGAIYAKNALNVVTTDADPTKLPAVLIYSTGCVKFKNDASLNGAVYGNPVDIKNGLEITYDPRVRATLGFGPNRYAQFAWNELTP